MLMERNRIEEQEGAPWDRLKPRVKDGFKLDVSGHVPIDEEVEESADRRVRESMDRRVREPVERRAAEPADRRSGEPIIKRIVREPVAERASRNQAEPRAPRPVAKSAEQPVVEPVRDLSDASTVTDKPRTSSFLPQLRLGTGLWIGGWVVLGVLGLFVLTAGGALLFDLGWGSLVEVTLGLSVGFAVVVALGGLFVSSVYSTMALRQLAQGGGLGAKSSQVETLRPILVLPPPTIAEERRATHHEGELEAGPRLPAGQKWNARIHNIGAGPALNGEARIYRRSNPEKVIILTVEPLGAGQFVDLAAAELPLEKVSDLEMTITYQDTFNRRFVTSYRLYARGEREASYWIGPAAIEPEHAGVN